MNILFNIFKSFKRVNIINVTHLPPAELLAHFVNEFATLTVICLLLYN